jgi:D-alanyl-D-alanine endopeptidase (penicillin-binding protein 7)
MTGPFRRVRGARKAASVYAAVWVALVFPSALLRAPGAARAGQGKQGDDPAPAPAPAAPRSSSLPRPPSLPSDARSTPPRLVVKSRIALVEDAHTSQVLLAKNADRVVPIASITKLMTAIVALDAKLPLEDKLTISDADRDLIKGTTSRLRVGWSLSREDTLHLALMASENRAAAALSRYYPGGRPAFIAAMNAKAAELGMKDTHFVNPNGLTTENVSTALDLVKLLQAAYQYPLIRKFCTDPDYTVRIGRHTLHFVNTDRLVRSSGWDVEIQKTGFINESGRCLVMRANVDGRDLIMIFLDAYGKLTRFADARRVRTQLALAQRK